MSYYLEVSASEVPPSSISESASKPKRPRALSTDDELKLYLFLKRIYSLFPRPDDILTEEETNSNIWGNDAQLDHGTISLILVYSGTEIGVPAITKSAKRYGLSVFDFQSGQIVRRRQIVPTAKELSLYREAHKYLLEMAEWSKFSGELDQLAGAKDLEERLRKQAETGYGPAKRALSFHCYLNYTRSRDKDERRVNITQAYKLIREVSNTAYSSRSLLETYKQAAKHEGVTLEE
jgi:hypothetical protein